MTFRNLKIAHRASLSFAVITLLVVILGFFSFIELRDLRHSEQELELDWLPSIQVSDEINQHLQAIRIESLRVLASPSGAEQELMLKRIANARKDMLEEAVHYRQALVSSPEEATLFNQLETHMQAYLDGMDKLLQLDGQEQAEQALEWANHGLHDRADAFISALKALQALNDEGAKQSGIHAAHTYSSSLKVIAAVVAVAIALTILFAWMLTRSIVTPIGASVRAAEAIARGDLTQPIADKGKDEASRLMVALHTMQQNLRDTLQQIADSSIQLASASEEMSAVIEEGSQGLQRQNNEIEQAATAVTEMSAAVDEVARNAASASEAAQQSSQAATVGKQRVDETLAAMHTLTNQVEQTSSRIQGLAAQSQDINKVLGVISAIAAQTNLLALNAAIEAARAGEQGRGFAVVADEVRALAHRTQTSTLEVEQMIHGILKGTQEAAVSMENSCKQVIATQQVAEQAGQALQEITHSASLIDDRTLQIATASEEQASVAAEVDQNLIRIRDLAIQSAAGAHETSVASAELADLATRLNTLVQRFKL
jgi:methyl-accepting chemotaxis protein